MYETEDIDSRNNKGRKKRKNNEAEYSEERKKE